MADDDKESKTEAATEQRVRDAIEKGDIPFSREAPVFASTLGLLIALALFARGRRRSSPATSRRSSTIRAASPWSPAATRCCSSAAWRWQPAASCCRSC